MLTRVNPVFLLKPGVKPANLTDNEPSDYLECHPSRNKNLSRS